MDKKGLSYLIIVAALVIVAGIWYSNQPQSCCAALSAELQQGKAILLDVRTPEEWNAWHAGPAKLFEVTRLQNGEMPDLPKDAHIYLYCRTGNRAGVAEDILKQNGFKNVVNLGGLPDIQKLLPE